jgi:hypothetical protein
MNQQSFRNQPKFLLSKAKKKEVRALIGMEGWRGSHGSYSTWIICSKNFNIP